MQQWLNEPKNQPIIYAGAGLLVVCSIVFILFQLGVFGNSTAPYVPPSDAPPTAAVAGPGAPTVGAVAPTTAPPPSAGPGSVASTSPGPAATPMPVAAAAPTNGKPGAPGSPVVLASVPNARRDPFAPYGGFNFALETPPRPRVDLFAPPVMITTYSPSQSHTDSSDAGSAGGQTSALTGRVSGVMLGNGAYALVDNNGQSLVLQPGDQYPGGGVLYSIQSDSVTVKDNGQLIKVPITTNESAATTPANPAAAYQAPAAAPVQAGGAPTAAPSGPPPGWTPPKGPTGPPSWWHPPTGPSGPPG
jgi:hypothetical protein